MNLRRTCQIAGVTLGLVTLSLTLSGYSEVSAQQTSMETLSGQTVDHTTPEELRIYSTMYSIGVEWDLTGDANHNAVCQVKYRVHGHAGWKEALRLFRVDCYNAWSNVKSDQPYNMMAGSILFLQPDTRYDVRLELADPEGGDATRIMSIRTRAMPRLPAGGRTFHVVPGTSGGDGSKDRPFQGLETAQASARPGDILLLSAGRYGSFKFSTPGAAGRYIVWKAAGDGAAVFDKVRITASHLWIKGLAFRGNGGNCLKAEGPVTDVVVSRNRFTGFHYSITLRRGDVDGLAEDIRHVASQL